MITIIINNSFWRYNPRMVSLCVSYENNNLGS